MAFFDAINQAGAAIDGLTSSVANMRTGLRAAAANPAVIMAARLVVIR